MITFKHSNIEPDYELQTLVTDKFSPFAKYLGDAAARAEVEFEKIVTHQNGPICRIEANVWRNGTLFRAEATEESFLKAVDVVRNQLEHEMERAHDKRINIVRRSARRVKEMLRFGVK